jgi:dienelactone hydrolase
MLFTLLLACGPATPDDTAALPEPLDLPTDPAAPGAPVGVRTVGPAEAPIEVWYPAPDAADTATDPADFMQFVPEAFLDRVGDFVFPAVDGRAVRDAPLREPEAPYPVVVFSHGFGGVRLQSLDVVTHLASRGYVVAAVDHPGRSMPDLLPCLFSPALDGCDLSGFGGEDPGVEGVIDALDWLEAATAGAADDEGGAFLAGRLDTEHVGLTGHSAGGGTTAVAGEEDDRFDALLPMAAGAVADRDVPQLVMSGTCDAIVPDSSIVEAVEARPGTGLVRVLGAGHLAFSDLCSLGLKPLAEEVLAERDDLNETIYAGLVSLASDGCPVDAAPPPELACGDSYLPLETSGTIVRHYATAFFDDALLGRGAGAEPALYAEAEVRTAR